MTDNIVRLPEPDGNESVLFGNLVSGKLVTEEEPKREIPPLPLVRLIYISAAVLFVAIFAVVGAISVHISQQSRPILPKLAESALPVSSSPVQGIWHDWESKHPTLTGPGGDNATRMVSQTAHTERSVLAAERPAMAIRHNPPRTLRPQQTHWRSHYWSDRPASDQEAERYRLNMQQLER